jgi:hypothetical protein
MVTNIMALRLKGCRAKHSKILIPSFYKNIYIDARMLGALYKDR